MKKQNRFFSRKGSIIFVGLLLAGSFFAPFASTGIFDYSAEDLISRESYRKISMDFKNASLTNVLKVFSEQAGLNFIASQGVQERTVTLFLENVPLQEALNKIMSANNLNYELDPGANIFVVKEAGRPLVETMTKIYNLKYARLSASKLQKVVDAGATSSAAAGGSGAAAGGGSGTSGGTIEETVAGVLSGNGKMLTDLRTNSLIVTDVPFQFEVIDKIIALLDVPTPQVMIEVEMLDVSKKTVDEMGVDTTEQLAQITGSSSQTRFPNLFSDGKVPSTGLPPTFTYGTLSTAVFSAVLDFLSTDTRTKFLARPRILTLSNETAEIRITTQEAIGQNTVTASSEGSATTTTEAERFETGVSLKVTPQVDIQTGTITMFIEPVVSEAKAGATFNNTAYKDPEVRSSATTLMVKNSETIVVGGLIKNSDTLVEKKMPFFGDIPFIGMMFRHKSRTQEERELIVFITPHIIGIDNAAAFAALDAASPGVVRADVAPYREQSSGFLRKDTVDSTLKRWEN